jgi:ER membrane protein complex subunit 2
LKGLEYSNTLRAHPLTTKVALPVNMLIENGNSDSANALQLSRQANAVLSKPVPTSAFFPLSLIAASETPDSWTDLERLFLACLRTGDDESAHLALERLTQRFGPQDERVMGLRGLYQEAEARNEDDLKKILAEYENILAERPMNVVRISFGAIKHNG